MNVDGVLSCSYVHASSMFNVVWGHYSLRRKLCIELHLCIFVHLYDVNV